MSKAPSSKYMPILPPRFAALTGELIASWSGTSTLLTMLLADLVAGKSLGDGDDITGMMVVYGMDARVQLGFIKSLGTARLGVKNNKNIDFIVEKLEKSKRLRDLVAHAIWSVDNEGRVYAHTLKTVGKVRYVKRYISSKSLLEEIASLMTTTSMLVRLFKENGYLANLQEYNGKFF